MFSDKYHLQGIFQFANNTWGYLDEKTNTWNGVVGMVTISVLNEFKDVNKFQHLYFCIRKNLQNRALVFQPLEKKIILEME